MRDDFRDLLRDWLARRCTNEAQRETILDVLSVTGFPLHPGAPNRGGTLTLECFKTIMRATAPAAFAGAAAVELVMAAGYLFDDVADSDGRLGKLIDPGEQIALSIFLLTAASGLACNAVRMTGASDRSLLALERFHRLCAEASAGQFLDARFQRQKTATADDALVMTSLKAGSFGGLAAGFGASLATDDVDIVTLFEKFGSHLFTYFQLVDDLRDAFSSNPEGNDFSRQKQTVPLVLFRNLLPDLTLVDNVSVLPLRAGPQDDSVLQDAFRDFGAQALSALVAEAHLNRAKADLAAIKRHVGTVGNLERFVRAADAERLATLAVA